MTDEELIARLRDGCNLQQRDGERAAARIEALVNEAVLSRAAYEGVSSLLLSVQQDCIKERQRAERLEAALHKLHHAVCGETGFAACVRLDSGKAYPWPALDDADETARATLSATTEEGK